MEGRGDLAVKAEALRQKGVKVAVIGNCVVSCNTILPPSLPPAPTMKILTRRQRRIIRNHIRFRFLRLNVDLGGFLQKFM
jgi:hypothetical protein